MINMVLVRRMERDYASAIRAEEAATTDRIAWRLAAASERALRRLQAARAGLPLPASRAPRTARVLAGEAFAALGTLGRSIARALQCAAALRKAQAVNALRRAAIVAARRVRAALRSAGLAIAKRALTMATARPADPRDASPARAAVLHAAWMRPAPVRVGPLMENAA